MLERRKRGREKAGAIAGIQVEYAIDGSELIHGLHLEVPIVASGQTHPHTYYEAIILCLIPLLIWCFDMNLRKDLPVNMQSTISLIKY